jgi:hypothetical protein
MAKGDNLAPGLGWNPGGMRMGGMATIGSQPMPNPMMQPMPQVPYGDKQGNNMASLGPSLGAMGSMMGQGQGQGMMKPAVEPMRAAGNMIPQGQEQGGVAPNFNPMEAIQRMINMRTQGTSTTTPMAPNSYALNPSANLFSGMQGNRNQQA